LVQIGMSFDIPIIGNSILKVYADFQTAVACQRLYGLLCGLVLAKLAYIQVQQRHTYSPTVGHLPF